MEALVVKSSLAYLWLSDWLPDTIAIILKVIPFDAEINVVGYFIEIFM